MNTLFLGPSLPIPLSRNFDRITVIRKRARKERVVCVDMNQGAFVHIRQSERLVCNVFEREQQEWDTIFYIMNH